MAQECLRQHVVVLCGPDELGLATVQALAVRGVHVFAATRSNEQASAIVEAAPDVNVWSLQDGEESRDLKELAASLRLHAPDVGLDALVTESVARHPYPVEFVDLPSAREHWRRHVEGTLIAIQVFLPLLRQARGRVVINGSIGGRLTLPFSGLLSSSGHAIRAIANTLRQEVHPWGVHVVLVEVAGVKNEDGFKDVIRDAVTAAPLPMRAMYGRAYRRITDNALRQEDDGMPPDQVALALTEILLSEARPRYRYVVGRRGRMLATLGRLPVRWQAGLIRRLLLRS